MKKLLCILISLCMIISLCTTTVIAESSYSYYKGTKVTTGTHGKAETDEYYTNTEATSRGFVIMENPPSFEVGKYLVINADFLPDENMGAIRLGSTASGTPLISDYVTSGWTVGRWNHITFILSGDPTTTDVTVTAYVNGAPADVSTKTKTVAYSSCETVRFAFERASGTSGTIAAIDIDTFTVEVFDSFPDMSQYAMPTLSESVYTVSSSDFYSGNYPTVSDIESGTAHTVRVYADDSFAQLLQAEEALTADSVIVVENTAGRMSYYSLKFDGIYPQLDSADGGVFAASATESDEADGLYGKADGDVLSVLTGEDIYFYSPVDNNFSSKSFIADVNFVPSAALEKIYLGNGSAAVSGAAQLGWMTGRWNKLRIVCSGTTAQVYINGVKVSDSAYVNAPTADSIGLVFEHSGEGEISLADYRLYFSDTTPPADLKPTLTGAAGEVIAIAADSTKTGSDYETNGYTLRVYKNSLMDEMVDNDEVLSHGNVLCFESASGAFSYFYVAKNHTSNVVNAGEDSYLNAEYIIADKSVRITGFAIKGKKSDVQISMTAYADKDKKITLANKAVYYSVKSAIDGNINISIPLGGEYVGSTMYTVVSCLGMKTTLEFSVIDLTLLESAVTKINQATSDTAVETILKTDIVRTGLDNSNASKDYSYMAKRIYELKPELNYTRESFVNEYKIAEALAEIKCANLTLDSFVQEYESYLNQTQKDKLNAVTVAQKPYVTQYIVKNTDASELGQLIDEAVWVANCKLSPKASDFRSLLEPRVEADKETLTYYNKMNSYQIEQIYGEVYTNRLNYENYSQMLKAVEDIAKGKSTGSGGSTGDTGSDKGSYSSDNSSGKASVGTNIITNSENTQTGESSFSDISGHWAEKDINALYAKQIINGYEDGSFRPANLVTRAEFVKMVVEMSSLAVSDNCSFEDVENDSWYLPYLSAAATSGVISGDGKRFYPNNNITRQDAAVIVYRILKNMGVLSISGVADYADAAQIAPYATEAVSALKNARIMEGSEGYFYPESNATRAEVAAIINRVCRKISR